MCLWLQPATYTQYFCSICKKLHVFTSSGCIFVHRYKTAAVAAAATDRKEKEEQKTAYTQTCCSLLYCIPSSKSSDRFRICIVQTYDAPLHSVPFWMLLKLCLLALGCTKRAMCRRLRVCVRIVTAWIPATHTHTDTHVTYERW